MQHEPNLSREATAMENALARALHQDLMEREAMNAASTEPVPGFRRPNDPRIPAGYRRRVALPYPARRR